MRQENAKTPRSSSGPDKNDKSRVSTVAREKRNNRHNIRTLDSFAVKARVTEATRYSVAIMATNFGRYDIVA